MIAAHPKYDRFFRALSEGATLAGWSGEVVRQAAPRYMSRPYRFTGLGSVFAGGRWSVKGLMPTVYASTDRNTLTAEATYKGLRYGWTPEDFKAQLIVWMRWELQAVVDLTSIEMLKKLKITKRDILCCDWASEQSAGREAITQALARAAFENLAEGLIVPSARHPGGVNIVYYPGHRRDGTVIRTLDEAGIPFIHGLQAACKNACKNVDKGEKRR